MRKITTIRALMLLLCVFCIVSFSVSCGKDDQKAPGAPVTPEAPNEPMAPEEPEIPEEPEVPEVPEEPEEPEVPEVPEASEVPEEPEVPEVPNDPDPAPPKDINLTGTVPYGVIFNSSIDGSYDLAIDFIASVKEVTGVKLDRLYLSDKPQRYEIVIGNVHSREDSTKAASLYNDYNNSDISIYAMKFYGERLVVTATDTAAFKYAVSRLLEFVSADGMIISGGIDEALIFDTEAYLADGTVKEYTKQELDSLALLSSIKVEGDGVTGFDKDIFEYSASANYVDGYGTVSAEPWLSGINISFEQATNDNGGIATVTATSKDGLNTRTYKVKFIMDEFYSVNSEVVSKGGTKGTVTIVLDDGIEATAKYVEELLLKYPEMTATFALITKNYAGFELSDDGTEYLRDENGNFIITQTDAQKTNAEYWQGLLERFPQVELTSHSHTHAYAGEDDSVVYTATDINGKKYIFPKGSISAEVFGSQQILRELFGQSSRGFVLPGISGKESGFTTNSWLDFIMSGSYLGARGTYSTTVPDDMVTPYDIAADESRLWRMKAFMVRSYTMALMNNGNFYPESSNVNTILNAGISHATNFIDAAMKDGNWACFCLHAIVEANSSGTHHIFKQQADALFAHANALAENGDAWVTTYGDALSYYVAWNMAKTEAIAHYDDSIELTVTTEEENDLFTVPLTVKVTVPPTWDKAAVTIGDEQTELSCGENNDGSKYVLVDVLPNSETVTILPLNP